MAAGKMAPRCKKRAVQATRFELMTPEDEPSACTFIIFIQALAFFHRAQVLI